MSARLELYVRRSNGDFYCEGEGRDTLEDRRRLDREALHALARPDVTEVELKVQTGRTGGYTTGRGQR